MKSSHNLLHSLKFDAIGTAWIIESSTKFKPEVNDLIFEYIDKFDRTYSRFKSDSLVSEISQNAGTYNLPTNAEPIFDLYKKLYEISHGKFTPLIGQTLSDAGYDSTYRLKPLDKISSPKQWDEVLKYKFPELTNYEPVLIDLGAGGKGYLADFVAEILVKHGHTQLIVNAGGDIVYWSEDSSTYKIALEDPQHPELAIGIAEITNGSLCGSAGNRRAWNTYNHIINPKTLTSPSHLLATWVHAESGLLADCLSTALFFVEPEVLKQHFDFEYARLHKDRSMTYSSNFKAEIF